MIKEGDQRRASTNHSSDHPSDNKLPAELIGINGKTHESPTYAQEGRRIEVVNGRKRFVVGS